MAVKLNLLPQDYALTGPVGKIIKFIRPLNVILLALFLVMAIGMGGFFIISSVSLKNIGVANDNLKNQIQAQGAAQQQMTLLKDRLSKIKTVQALPTSLKNLANVSPLLTPLTGDSLVSELGVDSQKTTASITFKSNPDLTNFVKSLGGVKSFTSITLGTFSYSPSSGYLMTLDFKGK